MEIPMDRSYEKGEFIPIEKTDFGFVQKSRYEQPDLYHEEVIEIESPFAVLAPSDTAVVTFIVMGDQNAGKSTFLHSFTYPFDPNFLEITSYLPILSSSFINTRFYFESENISSYTSFRPMDEPPFLDTDLGRSNILLSLESWEFFLDEFSLPRETFSGTLIYSIYLSEDSTRFVLLQFVELGGDHLDSLMQLPLSSLPSSSPSSSSLSPRLEEILQRSMTLLHSAREILYFVNATTLWEPWEGSDTFLQFRESSVEEFRKRMRFLAENFRRPLLLFFLSRLPAKAKLHPQGLLKTWERIDPSGKVQLDLPVGEDLPLTKGLKLFLDCLLQWEHWEMEVGGVKVADHLSPEGTLNPMGIIQILSASVGNAMGKLAPSSQLFLVAQEIFSCGADQRNRWESSPEKYWTAEWITRDLFWEWLGNSSSSSLPPAMILQDFETVAKDLIQSRIALKNNSSRVNIQRREKTYLWEPFGTSDPHVFAVRFPHHLSLFHFVQNYYSKTSPGSGWVQDPTFSASNEFQETLPEIQKDLENTLVEYWTRWVETGDTNLLHSFWWVWEEWLLSVQISGKTTGSIRFPRRLEVSQKRWEEMEESLKESNMSDHLIEVELMQ